LIRFRGNNAEAVFDGVQQAIEAAGAELLYLPPYSPGLNPIEMAFSKLKSRRFCGRQPSTPNPGLLRRIVRIIKTFGANAGISCAMPAMFKHDRNPR
jgi:transposase